MSQNKNSGKEKRKRVEKGSKDEENVCIQFSSKLTWKETMKSAFRRRQTFFG